MRHSNWRAQFLKMMRPIFPLQRLLIQCQLFCALFLGYFGLFESWWRNAPQNPAMQMAFPGSRCG